MSESKAIKFSFAVDENSARSVNRVLDGMIKKAQELGKAMSSMGGNGVLGGFKAGAGTPSAQSTLSKAAGASSPQKMSFTSILGGSADGFKKLAAESGAAMKAMTDNLTRATSQQQSAVDKLSKELENLAKMYEKVGGASSGSFGEKLQDQIMNKAKEASSARSELSKLKEAQGSMMSGPRDDIPNGGISGGGGKSFLSKFRPSGFGSMMSGLAGLAGVANFGLDEALSSNRAYSSAEATRGSLVENRIRGMHAGDTKFLFNLKMQQRDADARKDLEAQTSGTAANAEQIRGGLGQALGSLPILGGIARAIGITGPDTGGGILGGFTTTGQQSRMGQNALGQLDEKQRGTAMLYSNMAQDSFTSRRGASINMQRVIGIGGLRQRKDGQGYENQAGDLMTKLEGQGYDGGAYTSALAGLRGQAGSRFAGKNAYMSMAASAQGYGGFDQLLAASGRVGQGKTLAMGALGGGIDKAAGIQLGLGVLGGGYDPRGTTDSRGTLAAAQSGMNFTGGVSDFNKVQQAIGGLNYGSGITMGGIDSYQQGRNLTSAIGLNSSGSTYSQDYLANGMSMKQMLDMSNGGKLTETAKALGLNSDKIKAQLSDSMGSVFDRYVDEGKDDPMSKAIKGFQNSGMGYSDYLKKLKSNGDIDSIRTLGASSAMLTGGNEEEGIGAAQILSGQGAKLKSGAIGGAIGGAEKTSLESQEELQKKVDTTLKIIGKDLQDTIKAMPQAAGKLEGFGANMAAEAKDMIAALANLTSAMDAASTKLGKPRPPAGSQAGKK
jgi:hypothetical protein